jgi:hypothetical protein
MRERDDGDDDDAAKTKSFNDKIERSLLPEFAIPANHDVREVLWCTLWRSICKLRATK